MSAQSPLAPLSLTTPALSASGGALETKAQHDVEPKKISLISAEKLSEIVDIAEKEGKEGLEKLIVEGVPIWESCAEGYNALSLAFHRKKLNAAKALLDIGNSPYFQNPITGNCLTHIAAGVGFVEGLHLLPAKIVDPKFRDIARIPNKAGHTPLSLAIKYKQLGSLRTLIALEAADGKSLLFIQPLTSISKTPIELALLYGFPEAIPLLVKAGATISENGTVNEIPYFQFVIDTQDIEAMRALLHNGAKLDSKISGKPILFYAAEKGFVAGVRLLLELGAKADTVWQPLNETVLMYVLYSHISQVEKFEIVKLLIEFGADVNYNKPPSAPGGIVETPVYNAIRSKVLPVIQLFACRGANFNVPSYLYSADDFKTKAYFLIFENLVQCFEDAVLIKLEEIILKQYQAKISEISDLTLEGKRKNLDETMEQGINHGLQSGLLKPKFSNYVPPQTTQDLLTEVLKQFLNPMYSYLGLISEPKALKEEREDETFDDVENSIEIEPKEIIALFIKEPQKLFSVLKTIDRQKIGEILSKAILAAITNMSDPKRKEQVGMPLVLEREQLYSLVKILVDQGADLSWKFDGNTLLHLAVNQFIDVMDEKLIRLLAISKEHVNSPNSRGQTPVYLAVSKPELSHPMYGVGRTLSSFEESPVMQKTIDVFLTLLELGANCTQENWGLGYPSLIYTVIYSSPIIMEALIESGCDLAIRGNDEDTGGIMDHALATLPSSRSETKLRCLISSVAQIDLHDLFFAITINWLESIPFLFAKIDNPRAPFSDGATIFDRVAHDLNITELLRVCEQVKGQIDRLTPAVLNLLEVRIRSLYSLRKKVLPPTKRDALGLLDRQLLRDIIDQEVTEALEENLLPELPPIHPAFPNNDPKIIAEKMLSIIFEQASFKALMHDKNAETGLLARYKNGKSVFTELGNINFLKAFPTGLLSIISEYSVDGTLCINGHEVSGFSLNEKSVYGQIKASLARNFLHYFYMQQADYPKEQITVISLPDRNKKSSRYLEIMTLVHEGNEELLKEVFKYLVPLERAKHLAEILEKSFSDQADSDKAKFKVDSNLRCKLIQIFIHLGADLRNWKEENSGDTFLHLAGRHGAGAEIIQLLIDAGVSPNQLNKRDESPAYCTAWKFNIHQSINTFLALLKAKADIKNDRWLGNPPLPLAVMNSLIMPPKISEILIDLGLTLLPYKVDLIFLSFLRKDLSITRSLISANTPVRDNFQYAMDKGYIECIPWFIAAGADPYLPDESGIRAFDKADDNAKGNIDFCAKFKNVLEPLLPIIIPMITAKIKMNYLKKSNTTLETISEKGDVKKSLETKEIQEGKQSDEVSQTLATELVTEQVLRKELGLINRDLLHEIADKEAHLALKQILKQGLLPNLHTIESSLPESTKNSLMLNVLTVIFERHSFVELQKAKEVKEVKEVKELSELHSRSSSSAAPHSSPAPMLTLYELELHESSALSAILNLPANLGNGLSLGLGPTEDPEKPDDHSGLGLP